MASAPPLVTRVRNARAHTQPPQKHTRRDGRGREHEALHSLRELDGRFAHKVGCTTRCTSAAPRGGAQACAHGACALHGATHRPGETHSRLPQLSPGLLPPFLARKTVGSKSRDVGAGHGPLTLFAGGFRKRWSLFQVTWRLVVFFPKGGLRCPHMGPTRNDVFFNMSVVIYSH